MKKLAIKDLAEQTGVAAGTIRMWEQRYGFPEPSRTPAGYRIYTEQDVIALRRVVAYRNRGLSVPAALERARSLGGATDRPSIFAALSAGDAPVRPQKLHRATLISLSRAIEEEAMARAAGPIVIGASSPSPTTARSSTATGAWRTSPTRSGCSPTSTRRARRTRTCRPRSRSGRARRSATNGR
jgi:DNA-binding transcriptional MerR regulator